ncbi:hypothetical protein ACOMHN_032965 [Nucella lapillus]
MDHHSKSQRSGERKKGLQGLGDRGTSCDNGRFLDLAEDPGRKGQAPESSFPLSQHPPVSTRGWLRFKPARTRDGRESWSGWGGRGVDEVGGWGVLVMYPPPRVGAVHTEEMIRGGSKT